MNRKTISVTIEVDLEWFRWARRQTVLEAITQAVRDCLPQKADFDLVQTVRARVGDEEAIQ